MSFLKKLQKSTVPLINEMQLCAVLIAFFNVVFIVYNFKIIFIEFFELFGEKNTHFGTAPTEYLH